MDPLYIALHRVEITPPLGSRFAGHLNRDKPAEGVLDPLWGRLLYIRYKKEEVLLVNCDLLEFGKEEADLIQRELSATTGIPSPRILLTTTHTHTGPATLSFAGIPADQDYLNQLKGSLGQAARSLLGKAVPCTVSAFRTQVKVSCNRRKRIEGKIVMAPNPAGPVDPDFTIFLFHTLSGTCIGGIFHYSMHPTTLSVHSYKISADYPGRMLQHAANFFGEEPVFLFLQGACGDVKPAVFDDKGNFKEGEETDIEQLGQTLAKAAWQATSIGTRFELQPELRFVSIPFQFRFHPLPSLRGIQRELNLLEEAIQTLSARKEELKHSHIDPLKQALVFRAWAEDLEKRLRNSGSHSIGLNPAIERDLNALKIGEAVFLFIPGELFCATGLSIKAQSPFLYTSVACYADGTVGYIPTRASLEEGGYESREAYKYYGYPAPFHPDTEMELIKVLYNQLRSLAC